jgi:hypothetical protein
MSDTNMMSVNGSTIDISDSQMLIDSEAMSEEEIYGEGYVSVGGKAPRTDVETADYVDDISMKGSGTRTRTMDEIPGK